MRKHVSLDLKKMFVCPFPTDSKYLKIRVVVVVVVVVVVFSLILNFAFLNKNVQIKWQNI